LSTVATVRVRPNEGPAPARPSREALDEAAKLLAERGFKIIRVGRFGVSIAGEAATFSRELGVDVSEDRPLVESAKPRYEPLADLIDLVEVAPPPLAL
jgi:hypothetical protein